MVLQQDGKIPVWGMAAPGEAVTVTLGSESAKATADSTGKWRADLAPMATSATPLTLTVAGKNTLTFNNVLVGDVWVCSGQSNMEFALSGDKSLGGVSNAAAAVTSANDPQLRLFIVKRKNSLTPETNVTGEWKVCTPESAAPFSAVGYFFGEELRHSLNRPIGLIGTYWGGMPAQAFTSLSGLQKEPSLAYLVAAYQQLAANYDKRKAAYPAAWSDFQAKNKTWNDTVGKDYMPIFKKWQADTAAAQAAGQQPPPRPAPASPAPVAPVPPEGPPSMPTVLYNGMIAPLIPYGIKGAIWYQGESNANHGAEYATLFPRMISDWREKWGEGDFPFLFVQLANYQAAQTKPSEGGWAWVREAQLKTLSLPNTGMAVIIDIGDTFNIHPKDKRDVGARLALAAKHVAYGQDLVYSGPIYDSMTVEKNTIRLTFKNVGGGLQMSVPPWTPTGATPPAPTKLTGFAIAGADKNWAWADAKIDGNTVVVSCDAVAAPVAVRYGWANNPACNLYNKEGLPASPFRTDDWEDADPSQKPVPK
jgi:sialate O-acetylesterase